MSLASASKVVVCSLVMGIVFGCQTLEEIRPGVCGNGIVEDGEDCERTVPGNDRSFRCAACHFTCQRGDVTHRCPEGFACGVDGACRAPSGAFDPGLQINARAASVATADFDDDGQLELVASSERAVDVYDFSNTPVAASLRKRISTAVATSAVAPSALPALASRNGRRILASVREGGFVSAFVGTEARGLQAQFFATFSVTETDDFVLSSADVLPGSATRDAYGLEPLALVVTKEGPAMRLVQDAKFVVPLATLGTAPRAFVAPVRVARFDESLPCDAVVLAERRSNVLRIASTCRKDADGAVLNRVGEPGYVPPAEVALADGRLIGESGVHVVDVDADGHLDIVVDSEKDVAPRAALVAFGLGDGRFHGTPPKPAPATPDQTARTSDIVDDCEANAGFPRAMGQLTQGDTLVDCVLARGVQYRRPGNDTRFLPFYGVVREAITTDFNGDGLLDVVGVTSLTIELVASNGTFGHRLSEPANFPSHLSAADLDGDFANDIVYAEGAPGDEVGGIALRYGKRGGFPEAPTALGSSAGVTQVLTGAVSGTLGGADDLADVAVVSRDPNADRNPAKLFSVALLRGRVSRELEAPFGLGDVTNKLRGDALVVAAGRFLGGATDALATIALTTTPSPADNGVRAWLVPARASNAAAEDARVTTVFAPEGVLPGDDILDRLNDDKRTTFEWSRARPIAFDLDGAGPEELVVLVPPTTVGRGRVFVATARDTRLSVTSSFELGTRAEGTRVWWDAAKGDVEGDGKAELALRVDEEGGDAVFVYAPTSLDLASAGKKLALAPNQRPRSVGAAQLERVGTRTLLVGIETVVDAQTTQWGIYRMKPSANGYELGDLVLALFDAPDAFAAGDFDGDGIDDLAVSTGVQITVYPGRARGGAR